MKSWQVLVPGVTLILIGAVAGAAQTITPLDFSETNVEAVVKVLDGCALNNRYWIFAAGLTNVRVVLAVDDTQRGTFKVYVSPLNLAFPPIQDTSALRSCP